MRKWMQWNLVLLTAAVVVACGKKELRVEGFESYVDSFRVAASSRGRALEIEDLIIEFGTPASGNADATCFQGRGSPRIVIDKAKWDAMADAKKTALLFHEMGHCVLQREHKPGNGRANACPDSVMNPYTLSEFCFSKWQDEYLAELFNG